MLLKTASLPGNLLTIIRDKGTEQPFFGEYEHNNQSGTYLCRQCGLALFRAESQFNAGCGWPSFDREIEDTVLYQPDADGRRTEIVCARCHAHLGHVFHGEGFTAQNTRHCVNSLSLDFVNSTTVMDTEEAIFAAGCFWGVEYYFQKLRGVLKTEVGYTGGDVNHPSYEAVCRGDSGHYEAIRVIYDVAQIDFKEITKYFFEIHNFAQADGQGADVGQQYMSAIFYYDHMQKMIAEGLVSVLAQKNYQVATQLLPVSIFWPAEIYHQHYYAKNGKEPYCHRYTQVF